MFLRAFSAHHVSIFITACILYSLEAGFYYLIFIVMKKKQKMSLKLNSKTLGNIILELMLEFLTWLWFLVYH